MIIIKHAIRYGLLASVALLSACSNSYDDYVYQRPQQRQEPLPEIPEIASVRVEPAPQYIPRPVVKERIVKVVPKKRVVVKPYKPKVKKYTPEKTTDSVITQKEVAAVTMEQQWEEAEVNTDPYENIPESKNEAVSAKRTRKPIARPIVTKSVNIPKKIPAIGKVKPVKPSVAIPVQTESSSAVKSLLVKARADLALGHASSAIDKLERGLRIEPRNPDLWYQLAKTHYSKRNYSQTINMSKKAIQNTNRDYIIAKNWMLIKEAGLKSGNTVVVKEANDYFKVNP